MLTLILLHLTSSVWAELYCGDMTMGDCKIPKGTEVVKIWTRQEWYAKGVPKQIDVDRCRDLCAGAGAQYGEGCCLWGGINKDMGLKGVTESDFLLNGQKSVVSCFFFKGADHNPDVDLYRTRDYRQVCKDSSKFKSCSKHSDCDGQGGTNPLCKDNKCQPCLECLLCSMGIDGTCGDGCYDHFYGSALMEPRRKRCRKNSEASMQFAVENTIDTVDVAVYGFAMIGLGALMFGAYKHYSGKEQGEHAQIL